MNKSLMISIQPKHLVNILNGYKTLELRKTVPKDFKGWVYIYCTKGKPYIRELGDNYFTECSKVDVYKLNGKVVARFWFDEYTKIDNDVLVTIANETEWSSEETDTNELLKNACISIYDALEYSKGKDLYAWHIKKLEIFDTPLSLSAFYSDKGSLKRPPQSWQYIY